VHTPVDAGCPAPFLAGLRVVDSDISDWQGQVIYLDFDGARHIVYKGPVTVGPFDVPAFWAPGVLAGQEQIIISDVLARLEETFVGSGVIFTTERPEGTRPYSTIYIGGDDSAFSQYGSFLGLAEQVDVANLDSSDDALVFPSQLSLERADRYALSLAEVITSTVTVSS
jgi:hypothetical protein